MISLRRYLMFFLLFPERLDEYIDGNSPVRGFDAFVDGLDMDTGGFHRAVPTNVISTQIFRRSEVSRPYSLGKC